MKGLGETYCTNLVRTKRRIGKTLLLEGLSKQGGAEGNVKGLKRD